MPPKKTEPTVDSDAIKALLDVLTDVATAPKNPVPMNLENTILDHKQGEFCVIVLSHQARSELNEVIRSENAKIDSADYWVQYTDAIVEAACRLGVTDPKGELMFKSKAGQKILKQLHPKITKIFWREVMLMNGYFDESTKNLIKNSSGTENSNSSTSSALCSTVPEQSYPVDLDPTMEPSSNDGEPITV